jgi:hypothetical protein
MSELYLSKGLYPAEFLRPSVDFILGTQQADGCIPWFPGAHADPWDHVEAAMGLSIAGEWEAAARAYRWLARQQLGDGSWWVGYKDGQIHDRDRRETNFVAYVATGLWHHYLVSGDRDLLEECWPMVESAIEFVLAQQSVHGEVCWAVDADGTPRDDALVTGCSSIHKSLECAINIAHVLYRRCQRWLEARWRLGEALRHRPERFDRNWESKARYSMDWFYPVLGGVLPRVQARARLQQRWDVFVKEGMGCRCVSDEPWVTVAESAELTMALLGAGDHARAARLFSWLHQWRDGDGAYWTGYQWVEDLLWPEEKPTWTAGAILLAADALTEHTGASRLFTEVSLIESPEDARRLGARHFLAQP